ncbi:MAG: hypothetical protein JKY65_24910 [Planctomycetes bacterium]|nr:hypothetical protein [Planctomycetota bacterium]
MSDEEIRAKEREGELDLPAILRAAPDLKRRLGLIRLCAMLGHEEAERWRLELGQHATRGINPLWHPLSRERTSTYLLGAIRRGIAAEEREGRTVPAQVAVALDSTLRRFRRQHSREDQAQVLDGLRTLQGRIEAEADPQTPANFLWAFEPSMTPASIIVQVVAVFVELGLLTPEDDWSTTAKPLEVLMRLRDRAVQCTKARGLSDEEVDEARRAEGERQITSLRDDYLWPEVIRR